MERESLCQCWRRLWCVCVCDVWEKIQFAWKPHVIPHIPGPLLRFNLKSRLWLRSRPSRSRVVLRSPSLSVSTAQLRGKQKDTLPSALQERPCSCVDLFLPYCVTVDRSIWWPEVELLFFPQRHITSSQPSTKRVIWENPERKSKQSSLPSKDREYRPFQLFWTRNKSEGYI